jgi:diguanylate cyclase (GGDEF)-like protein
LIFLAEFVVMILLMILPPLSIVKQALIDATLLSTITTPLLYLLIYKPLQLQLSQLIRLKKMLSSLSFTDELTSLYNRRGFMTLSEKQLQIAGRLKKRMLAIFVDVNDLKLINDKFGHQEGDEALIESANVLKRTFRESDIIARIGGDEFAVLLIEETQNSSNILRDRLKRNLVDINAEKRNYKLSLSVGIISCEPDCKYTIDELLALADKAMYEDKATNKGVKS